MFQSRYISIFYASSMVHRRFVKNRNITKFLNVMLNLFVVTFTKKKARKVTICISDSKQVLSLNYFR